MALNRLLMAAGNRHRTGIRTCLVVLICHGMVRVGMAQGPAAAAPTFKCDIVNTYPHDPGAFSQGLLFHDGKLYESTGRYGRSSVRRVDLETGAVEKQFRLNRRLFGEGMTLFEGKLYQLTWKQGVCLAYDADTLRFLKSKSFSYQGEGWGLTHNDKQLIMSDGTDRLRFLEPATGEVVRTVRVQDNGQPVRDLNELEFIGGRVYANVWYTSKIAVISPKSGAVLAWLDLSNLPGPSSTDAVLNGIAHDAEGGRLFVTGKNWPNLFEIKIRRSGTAKASELDDAE